MSKSFYIKLTLGVYQVTELFPARQALKDEIRKTADEVLVGLLTSQHEHISQNIQKMNNLLNLAEGHDWVDPRNFLVLRREYAKIARFIREKGVNSAKTVENPEPEQSSVQGHEPSFALVHGSKKSSKNRRRQEKILELMISNGKVKVSDLAKTFPNLNRRTLIRDLGIFCQTGVVERNGNGRGVCYTIRNATF